MTLNDAFESLTIEQVEKALVADAAQGFPQDVFGLARLVLRTFTVLDPGCAAQSVSIAQSLETDSAIEQRIADMLEIERLKVDPFDDAAFGWHSDTRH